MATTGGSIAVSSFPSSSYFSRRKAKPTSALPMMFGKLVTKRQGISCSAVQESSTPTVAETKEVKTTKEAAPVKPKPPAKAPAKPLPQLMEEDVIPSLKSVLVTQADISELQLSFQANRDFLSSYGTGASTVEPFLIDEKKITAKHVVFRVEKRLAAQGIIPVWKE